MDDLSHKRIVKAIQDKQVLVINYRKVSGEIVIRDILPLEIKFVGNTRYLYASDLKERHQTKRFIYQNILVVNYPKKGKIPQYALDEWERVKSGILNKLR